MPPLMMRAAQRDPVFNVVAQPWMRLLSENVVRVQSRRSAGPALMVVGGSHACGPFRILYELLSTAHGHALYMDTTVRTLAALERLRL